MKSSLHYLVAARQSEIAELEQLRSACSLVTLVSQLIHQLQKERGLSNLFLASNGAQGAQALAVQLLAVDESMAAVRDALRAVHDLSPNRHSARLFNAIAYLLQGLDALPVLRARIQPLSLSSQESTSAFVRLIAGCLALVFEAADNACDPDISRLLVALFYFMEGKELAGQERAAGVAAFGSGLSDAEQQRRWLHLIESQEQCFQVFAEFAPTAMWEQWQTEAERSTDMAIIERLRRVACTAPEGHSLDTALGARWFAACTMRLDAMYLVEGRLADELVTLCNAKLEIARSAMQCQQALLDESAQTSHANPHDDDMAFFTMPAPGGPQPRSTTAYGPQLERSILSLVQEQSQRLQTMQAEIDKARGALNERKTIERAKGVLMNQRHMSEGDAHKLMRQTAMNQNRRMLDVAEAVLSAADLLPDPSRP